MGAITLTAAAQAPGTGGGGATGANGSTWFSGSGAPSDATGANGDYYFRTDTSDVYLKTAGVYSIIANIKGETGATGSQGATGAAGADGATTLDELTDVVITTPATNQVIKYNGTNWVNDTIAGGGGSGATTLDELTDVVITTPTHGQVMKYDSVSSSWKNDVISPISPLTITAANASTANKAPLFRVPPRSVEVNGVLVYEAQPNDKWIDQYISNDQIVTSLIFDDLKGIEANFNPNTMVALTSLSMPVLAHVGGAFNPSSMSILTSISAPALMNVGGNFNPAFMAALTSLSMPALVNVGGNFNPNNTTTLTSLSMPALVNVGGAFNPATMAALTILSIPVLANVGGNFNPATMAALTSLSMPALVNVGGNLNPNTMGALTSISAPALVNVGGLLSIHTMASLASINISAIERIGITVTSGNVIQLTTSTANLTTFELPATLKQVGGTAGNVVITSAKLNQTSVDSILVRLAALDGTNGTTAFSNRTVTITGTSSAPSATGLAAKTTLQGRGCTVTHN